MALAARLIAGALVVGALMAFAGTASADVQACLAASEKGQKLRSAGKLREAQASFVICGADNCPAIVRHDCAQWNGELQSTLPTVVFGAKDKSGRDLFEVTVSMDGTPLVTKLDGKSVVVDPGKHTFKFESNGMPAVSETALVKEGERARNINVTFDAGEAPPPPPPAKIDLGTDKGQGQPSAEEGHTIAPWIVVAVGGVGVIVGVIIFATAPSRPANCNATTQKCTRGATETDDQLQADKDQAGSADSQPVLGGVVAGIGLVVAAGGLIWHFVEPTGPAKAAVHVTPWTTGKSSGFALGGTF